jgi:hypothetical protein
MAHRTCLWPCRAPKTEHSYPATEDLRPQDSQVKASDGQGGSTSALIVAIRCKADIVSYGHNDANDPYSDVELIVQLISAMWLSLITLAHFSIWD